MGHALNWIGLSRWWFSLWFHDLDRTIFDDTVWRNCVLTWKFRKRLQKSRFYNGNSTMNLLSTETNMDKSELEVGWGSILSSHVAFPSGNATCDWGIGVGAPQSPKMKSISFVLKQNTKEPLQADHTCRELQRIVSIWAPKIGRSVFALLDRMASAGYI